MNMDASSLFTGHFAIDIVNIAIIDVYMPIDSFGSIGKNVYAKQVALIIIRSVSIGYFQAVYFPIRQILQ